MLKLLLCCRCDCRYTLLSTCSVVGTENFLGFKKKNRKSMRWCCLPWDVLKRWTHGYRIFSIFFVFIFFFNVRENMGWWHGMGEVFCVWSWKRMEEFLCVLVCALNQYYCPFLGIRCCCCWFFRAYFFPCKKWTKALFSERSKCKIYKAKPHFEKRIKYFAKKNLENFP